MKRAAFLTSTAAATGALLTPQFTLVAGSAAIAGGRSRRFRGARPWSSPQSSSTRSRTV